MSLSKRGSEAFMHIAHGGIQAVKAIECTMLPLHTLFTHHSYLLIPCTHIHLHASTCIYMHFYTHTHTHTYHTRSMYRAVLTCELWYINA